MAFVENPYASQDLYIAANLHDQLASHVSRAKGAPFPRWIDLWWSGLCIGYEQGSRTPLPAGRDDRTKFNDGGILSSDPWRITHLELLALADGGEDALMSPSGVIAMASEYAHTGLVWIADALLGEAQATIRLMNRLSDFVD